jgi:hypothetical protein
MQLRKCAFVIGLLAGTSGLLLAPHAAAQIQSTISCPSGHGYWDVLSVMMMDPSLASDYHMEGYDSNGNPSSYVYTTWVQDQTKVYYVKNPQGNPWDINLYDTQTSIPQQGYIYQWVTDLDEYNGQNYWNDPTSCKKFNDGNGSDYSMRWAARCAALGGTNSSIWNAPPPAQPYNTNYYIYVDKVIQNPNGSNLNNANLQLLATQNNFQITDTRGPKTFDITVLPLQYTYSCSVSGNLNSCKYQEIFYYGLDTTTNPVDGIKHSYGWVKWQYFVNATGGNPNETANWGSPQNSSVNNYLVAGQVPINFQCF